MICCSCSPRASPLPPTSHIPRVRPARVFNQGHRFIIGNFPGWFLRFECCVMAIALFLLVFP